MISRHSKTEQVGNRIGLFTKKGSLYDSNAHHNHFTGNLLWENTTNETKHLVSTNTTKKSEKTATLLPVFFVAQNNTSLNQSAVIPFDIAHL